LILNKKMAGEHENRTHLSWPKPGNSGFEVRDGHQLRNLSLVIKHLEIEDWKFKIHADYTKDFS